MHRHLIALLLFWERACNIYLLRLRPATSAIIYDFGLKSIAHINKATLSLRLSFCPRQVVLSFSLQDDMAEVESSSSIDTERLSSFLDIDGPDLQSILDSATEGIAFLLQQVQVKVGEFEQISNAKELLEVNYGTPLLWMCLTGSPRGAYYELQGDEYAGATPESCG